MRKALGSNFLKGEQSQEAVQILQADLFFDRKAISSGSSTIGFTKQRVSFSLTTGLSADKIPVKEVVAMTKTETVFVTIAERK